MIGTRINHYRIIEKIGAGGMGEVYLAEDTRLDRKVALKFLPDRLSADPEFKSRFEHEAKAAAALEHPNIITVYELGEHEGRLFIAMQRVAGSTLTELIKSDKLNISKALDLGSQICEGLAAAHKAGIVHRDIKPANILVDESGRVHILDFGLAKSRRATTETKIGSTLGTVQYESPEQSRGQEVDARSDLFSVGVILYEMITGKQPFSGEYEEAIRYAVSHEEASPLSRYASSVSEDLQRLVSKLLEKDASVRYQSAEGVLSDLRKLTGGAPARVSAPVVQPAKRSTTVAMISGAVVIAAVASYMFWPEKDPSPTVSSSPERKMLAVLPFENLGAPEDEYFADGITDEITSRVGVLKGLGVIARTSILQYKGTTKRIAEIGSELNVDYILEGTIRWDKSGDTDRVRITPQLIRVSDETHLWADNIERPLTQIFVVQSEIATSIVNALDITLAGPDETSAATAQPTENMEAYDFYLRGKDYYENRSTAEDGDLAIEMFEKAVALDSTFFQANYYLARILSNRYFNYEAGAEILVKAKKAADGAIKFANGAPEGQLALGYYYYYASRDYERALEMFQPALEKQPNNSDLLTAIGFVLRRQGKIKEAADNQLRGIELDPYSTGKIFEVTNTLFYLRRYAEIIEFAEHLRSRQPDNAFVYLLLYFATFGQTGSIEEAHKRIEQSAEYVDERDPSIRQIQQVHYQLSRDFETGLEYLSLLNDASSEDSIKYYLRCAGYHYFLNNKALNQIYADSARMILERKIMAGVPSPENHIELGTAYAYLDRKDDARSQAEKGIQSLPVSRDYFLGIQTLSKAAQVSILIGDYEEALDRIEFCLSNPSYDDATFLRIAPQYDSLRDHPRFQALLEKYKPSD